MAALLFSSRGLLRLSPWLVLAPLGLLGARQREPRAEVVVCAVIVGASLAYNSGAAVMSWAQLENRGGDVGKVRVIFSIYGPNGEPVRTKRVARMHFRAGQRERLRNEWSPDWPLAGEYRLVVEVLAAGRRVRVDGRTILVVEDAVRVRIGP